jgi:tRNA threonylcarbamoyladenosine biosynthesis protein TsaB
MKILALEFSSRQRSVAVATRTPTASGLPDLVEVVETGSSLSEPLAMIQDALRRAGLEREQIEGLAIGLGPGSYSGIRTGIALAQGWRLVRNVKLIGVSSAESLAAQASADGFAGRVLVVIDAQRQEFYAASYDVSPGGYRELEPLRLISGAEVQERGRAADLVIGPDVVAGVPACRLSFPRAATLASLALTRTDSTPAEAMEPIYLRETSFVKAPPARYLS